MGLELVGSNHGQGDDGQQDGPADGSNLLLEQLAEAARLIGGARERLQNLVERTAELRRRLESGGLAGTSSGTKTPSP